MGEDGVLIEEGVEDADVEVAGGIEGMLADGGDESKGRGEGITTGGWSGDLVEGGGVVGIGAVEGVAWGDVAEYFVDGDLGDCAREGDGDDGGGGRCGQRDQDGEYGECGSQFVCFPTKRARMADFLAVEGGGCGWRT